MQVLCINSGLHITKNGLVNDASEFLTESEKYTVIDIVENKFYTRKDFFSKTEKRQTGYNTKRI